MAEVLTAALAMLVVIAVLYRWQEGSLNGDLPEKKKRSGPDMAFSAGRDAAHQNTRLRQVFIPMLPEEEPAMRDFYFGTLELMEMRSPNEPPEPDGFWAVTGTRHIYCGTRPRFAFDPDQMPAFPMRRIDQVAARLEAAGHPVTWDTSITYVRRLIVTDPGGTQIAVIAG